MVKFDQYITKLSVAEHCWNTLEEVLSEGFDSYRLIEPSVGLGSFVETSGYPVKQWQLYELDPTLKSPYKEETTFGDYLEQRITYQPHSLTIGNPPFGKRSKLAIDFINHSAEHSDIIAFILPIQFNKYLTQRRLRKDLELIHVEPLTDDAFMDRDKADLNLLRTSFYIFVQGIWKGYFKDLRIRQAPPTGHPDFKLYQYNRTKEAEKYFDYDWDFAVLRQGYGDYETLYIKDDVLDRKKQYLFIKANNEEVLSQLKQIDFNTLSQKNTIIPGFGKADVVEAYERMTRR